MNARRSTQGVLPPCVSGLFSSIGSAPAAVSMPGIATRVTRRGPGRRQVGCGRVDRRGQYGPLLGEIIY